MLCVVAVVVLGGVPFVCGQGQDGWDEVVKIRSGTRLYVTTQDEREHVAKLVQADGNKLVLKASGGRTIELPQNSIRTIHRARKGSVLKRALIGAAAGAGIGVGIGVLATAVRKSNGLEAAGGFLIGIPVGAAVGAATTSTKRGALIYKAP